MYTTHANLEHTIKLQEELFRQRLRLRGINLNNNNNSNNNNNNDNNSNINNNNNNNNNNNDNNKDTNDDTLSEHFYHNIDSETSDIEKKTTVDQNRSLPLHKKKPTRTVTFCLNKSEQQKMKMTSNRVRFSDQSYLFGKRKNFKSLSKTSLSKLTTNKQNNYQYSTIPNKKLLSSHLLTVTIT